MYVYKQKLRNKDSCFLYSFAQEISHLLGASEILTRDFTPSYRDGSNEGAQCMFSLRNKQN